MLSQQAANTTPQNKDMGLIYLNRTRVYRQQKKSRATKDDELSIYHFLQWEQQNWGIALLVVQPYLHRW